MTIAAVTPIPSELRRMNEIVVSCAKLATTKISSSQMMPLASRAALVSLSSFIRRYRI